MDVVRKAFSRVWKSLAGGVFAPWMRFSRGVRFSPNLFKEHAMADVAFVVTTIAVFALVVLIAKGVAKL
ncbi:hypothetical protein [Streptomyces sp. ZL-24]|uniref:hypothetical protein n=1 Tax=Streptomyces sp. ZL-24 TaxID=1933029 RepID=UPI0011B0A03A|nr:hypothetical protein [Streptomyces sp. ZL-24]